MTSDYRIWLAAILISGLLLSACGQNPAPLDPTTTPPATIANPAEPTEPPATETLPPATDPQPGTDNLDLRFANVTQVEFERLDEGEYRFSVTLYHDDQGEAPNFADAWQVLDLAGNILGERELLHSHGTQPFTRSESITIPNDISTVIVRGHDMTHGFGGQGMRVDLTSGQTTPIQIKSDE